MRSISRNAIGRHKVDSFADFNVPESKEYRRIHIENRGIACPHAAAHSRDNIQDHVNRNAFLKAKHINRTDTSDVALKCNCFVSANPGIPHILSERGVKIEACYNRIKKFEG